MQKCLEGKRRHGGECQKVSSGIIGHLLQPGLRHRRAERTGAGGQTRAARGICFRVQKESFWCMWRMLLVSEGQMLA